MEGVIYATMYHREVHPRKNNTPGADRPARLFWWLMAHPVNCAGRSKWRISRHVALLERGHRRIGFINDSNPVPASVGRLEGYKQALAAHNVPFDESLVSRASIARGDMSVPCN